jgi:hypothetical protein
MRITPILLFCALAGCNPSAQPPAREVPARKVMGEVSYQGRSFVVVAANPEATIWWVRADDRSVQCSKPTLEACGWSLRHYYNSQQVIDDLAG